MVGITFTLHLQVIICHPKLSDIATQHTRLVRYFGYRICVLLLLICNRFRHTCPGIYTLGPEITYHAYCGNRNSKICYYNKQISQYSERYLNFLVLMYLTITLFFRFADSWFTAYKLLLAISLY